MQGSAYYRAQQLPFVVPTKIICPAIILFTILHACCSLHTCYRNSIYNISCLLVITYLLQGYGTEMFFNAMGEFLSFLYRSIIAIVLNMTTKTNGSTYILYPIISVCGFDICVTSLFLLIFLIFKGGVMSENFRLISCRTFSFVSTIVFLLFATIVNVEL